MTPIEMTCRELVELITDYLEDTLSAPDRMRFDSHLVECPHCRTYLAQMHDTIRILGRLTEEDISAETKDELLTVFRGWKQA